MRAPEASRMRLAYRTAHAPFGGTAHVQFRAGPHAGLLTSPHAGRSTRSALERSMRRHLRSDYGTALGSSESAVGLTPNAPCAPASAYASAAWPAGASRSSTLETFLLLYHAI